MTRTLARLGMAAAALALGAAAHAQDAPRAAWGEAAEELFATLPVQQDGRVKPMDTYARFTMLRLNGKRSFTTASGERLAPTPWLMDCLLRPERAKAYRHFLVDSSEAVAAMGVPVHEKRRDRYSYNELAPGLMKLFELASRYSEQDRETLSRLEMHVLNLADNVHTFEQLVHFLDFARAKYAVPEDSMLADALPGQSRVPLSTLLRTAPPILRELMANPGGMEQDALNREMEFLRTVFQAVDQDVRFSAPLALFPPEDAGADAWYTPAEVVTQAFERPETPDELVGLLERLEEMAARAGEEPAAFHAALKAFHTGVVQRATVRGEYAKVPLEYRYYQGKYLFYSQWLFVLSFLIIAVSWALPDWRVWRYVHLSTVTVPTVLLLVAITYRCIIRGRPPVTTLYETILFVTAVIAVAGIVIEIVNRRQIAIAVAAFLGAAGLFIAYRYEAKEAVDTMPSLVAVLDTNFWLSTHVTTITMGYAAGLLAAALAHVYIVGRLFRLHSGDMTFYDSLARVIYGVVCFCFLFSIIGTVLGGIWANESWGRFWGWDPKENGALLICIWGLIILHARLGGYIQAYGTAVTSVLLGMIVAFSWWGVNLLGVGLHSYGFTSGIMNVLAIFWTAETLVAALGLYAALRDKPRAGVGENKAAAEG